MKEKTKKRIFFLIRLFIFLGIFIFLLFNFNLDEFILALKSINLIFLIFGMVLSSIIIFLLSLRFSFILSNYNITQKKLKTFLMMYYSQFIDNFFFGFIGGDAYKITSTKGDKKNITKSVLLDRLTGLIILAIFAIPGIFIYLRNLLDFTNLNFWNIYLIAILFLFFITGFIILYAKNNKFKKIINELKLILLRPKLLFLGVLIQLLMIFNLYLVFLALGWKIPFTMVLIAVPLINLIIMLPISIKGYGIREFLIIYFFNVDINQVLVFTLINTAITILHTSIGAVCHLIYEKTN